MGLQGASAKGGGGGDPRDARQKPDQGHYSHRQQQAAALNDQLAAGLLHNCARQIKGLARHNHLQGTGLSAKEKGAVEVQGEVRWSG